MKLFAEIEAEVQALIAKAKAAWDAGDAELHRLLHIETRAKAAEAGASVSVSGQEDGVLVAHDPATAPQPPAGEPVP
jgi:NCAIR mutase (PurE)-related protein